MNVVVVGEVFLKYSISFQIGLYTPPFVPLPEKAHRDSQQQAVTELQQYRQQ